MSGAMSATRARVRELLQCPIKWRDKAPGYPVVDELEHFWRIVATQCLKAVSGNFDELIIEGSSDLPEHPQEEPLSDEALKDLSQVIAKLKEAEGETFETFFSPGMLDLEEEEDLREELPQIEAWIERSKACLSDQF